MTVKEEIQLRLSGVTSAEIKDLKEREKLEKGEPPKDEPPKDEPPKDNDVSRETLEELKKLEEEKKQLETQLAKMQEENSHRDLSKDEDIRSDFAKGVEIFKNAF